MAQICLLFYFFIFRRVFDRNKVSRQHSLRMLPGFCFMQNVTKIRISFLLFVRYHQNWNELVKFELGDFFEELFCPKTVN